MVPPTITCAPSCATWSITWRNSTLETISHERRLLRRSGRRRGLAVGLEKIAAGIEIQGDKVEWVRPDGGALCCIRLRPDVYADTDVDRFFARLQVNDAMVAEGRWFGDETRVFRLGFGFLPIDMLDGALAAVARALDEARPASAA
jgi:DNA-binding transcriptional MocR family regulator